MACYRELGTVQKPYQYIGHEENAYRKDFDAARVRLCIAFPDAYEVGMSNVGMQIIYHVVNEQADFMADRVYAPLVDMGAMLKKTGQRLGGRESQRSLAAFDCIGFTLQYELCYTNILYMLELGGIARHAHQRQDGDPFVMAGGPCVFNPEPVAAFFDFFVVGEGEEVVLEVMDVLASARERKRSRAATLVELSSVKGVYVPSFYEPEYTKDGQFFKLHRKNAHAPRWVERRIIKDLDQAPYPSKPVTPAIQPIHERVSVEIQRGCTRACRFCQAGYVYRPRRERNPNTIFRIIDESVRNTGITDIGLLSLSSADYSHLHPLMKKVMASYKKEHLSVSLPSTRLEALREEYLDVLKEERRSGFTIAPEAGSQRLRNAINKNFTEAEIVETARMLFRAGWQSIKMYFMIGQPTETDDDVIAIAELGNTLIRKTSDLGGRRRVTISVSNFVPKPHTPFQWHEQISHAEIRRKQRLIRDHIQFKHLITFRCHEADNSMAEGLVARADRRAAALIERAYELGAVFDCWQDRFDLDIWLKAIAELKDELGHDFLADGLRRRDLGERLPWHRVYSGIHPKFFKNEWHKAVYGIATEDCSFSACHECGLCNETTAVSPIVHREPVAMDDDRAQLDDATPTFGPVPEVAYRFQYRKVEAGVFLAVSDLQNVLVRAFKRAGIQVAYDLGLRPRPKLSLSAALPLGVSSQCELFDISLLTPLAAGDVLERVNRFLPDHVAILTGVKLERDAPSISRLVRAMSYAVRLDDLLGEKHAAQDLEERIAAIHESAQYPVHRLRKSKDGTCRSSTIDLKESLRALCLEGDMVRFTIDAPDGQSLSPHVVLDALVGARVDVSDRQVPIHKTGFTAATEQGGLI